MKLREHSNEGFFGSVPLGASEDIRPVLIMVDGEMPAMSFPLITQPVATPIAPVILNAGDTGGDEIATFKVQEARMGAAEVIGYLLIVYAIIKMVRGDWK